MVLRTRLPLCPRTISLMALRLRRLASGLLLFLLAAALLLWLASALVVSINAPKIAQAIEAALGPGFEVGEVGGDLFRGVLISGCSAAPDPTLDSSGLPLLKAGQCRITLDWVRAFQGQLAVGEIRFSDVELDLRRGTSGQLLWPPFIARAATAQGASWNLSAFGWRLERAQVRFHPAAPAGVTVRPVPITVPLAAGRFDPASHFQISQCQGDIAGSAWTLAGTLALSGDQALNGLWRVREAGLFTLAEAFTSGQPGALDTAILPSGTVDGALNIGGTLKDPRLSGKVNWREGKLRHFAVEQGSLDLEWRPGLLTLRDGVLKAYGGRLQSTGAMDFRVTPPTYLFTAQTEGLQLGDFLAAAGYGKIEFSGQVAGQFEGGGPLTGLEDFRASGLLTAKDGQLLNPLYDPAVGGVERLLKYKSLTTGIEIARQTIELRDTKLDSPDLQLAGRGWIHFRGDLDCTATLSAPARTFANHPEWGPPVRALNLTDQPIALNVKVAGTIQEPEVLQAEVDQATVMEAARQGLLGKIKDLFKPKE